MRYEPNSLNYFRSKFHFDLAVSALNKLDIKGYVDNMFASRIAWVNFKNERKSNPLNTE